MPTAIFDIPDVEDAERAAIGRIEAVQHGLRNDVRVTRSWDGLLRRDLQARATRQSTGIEGFDVPDEVAIAAVDGDLDSDDPAAMATRDYQRAMNLVLRLAGTIAPVSSSLLLALHFIMNEHDHKAAPGQWRRGPAWVQRHSAGEQLYLGAPRDGLEDLIDELCDQLNHNLGSVPAMVLGAMAHLNVVCIHPFEDGNGRMSRAVQTLVVTGDGNLPREFVSMEEYLGRNSSAYYEVLAAVGGPEWDPGRDARPWVRFCLQAHYAQALDARRRVAESARRWEMVDEIVTETGVPPRSAGPLSEASKGLVLTNGAYRDAVAAGSGEKVSDQVATKDLGRLVAAGLLERTGEKRGARYSAGGPLVELRERLRAELRPIDASGLFTE